MGLTGELMKSVFSKGRPDMNGGRCGFKERRKWGGVRSYLCGDEFGLVPAEEDSASLQPLPGKFTKEEEMRITEVKAPLERQNSISQLLCEQDAAIVIQTAFRSYKARNQRKEETEKEEVNRLLLLPIGGRDRSPNVESTNTSLEVPSAYSVQLLSGSPAKGSSGGESIETPGESSVQGQSLQQDRSTVYPQKRKPRTRVLQAKEEWDDSTVNSNVAEMRIKRRLEAATRRERALAYAFSQQLRVCSRKRPEGEEPNAGWSWFKRWMATRPSENLSPLIPLDGDVGAIRCKQQCGKTRRKLLDLAGEEKESSGPNQVPLNMGSFTMGTTSTQNTKPGVRKFRKPRKLPNKKVSEDYQYGETPGTKGIDLRHEEQLTKPTNTAAASVIWSDQNPPFSYN